MKNRLIFWALLVATCLARGEDPESLPDGIAVKVGKARVELRVASPHAFLLRTLDAGSTPPHSIYVSPTIPAPASFTVTHDGDIVGIKTSFGELRFDTKNKTWSMRDAAGKSLTDWAQWRLGGITDTHSVAAPAGIDPATLLYYGSGSVPNRGALTQINSNAAVGNGTTAAPQFWSTAGYGALLIGAEDNAPCGFRMNPKGGLTFVTYSPAMDLYLAPASTIGEWLRAQAELTGFAPVPPRWSLGYLQSRWGWKGPADITETANRFRKDNLPVDAFIFDFEWYTKMPDYKVGADGSPDFVDFDWNPDIFPDPAGQIDALAKQGIRMIGIRKPRVGNAANITMARAKGWILPSNSKEPSNLRNIDFSNPDVRAWYGDNLRKFYDTGVAGFWNDEGELRLNEYMNWNLAESDLFAKEKPGLRFWSINRAFAPGLQRFGVATWSGDIQSDWPTLQRTTGELLAYGLSGIPYAGCDIGGFEGALTPELLTRWMEAGVFFPVMRSHSCISNPPRFPWLWGDDAENAIRSALDLRYRLIPYYNSLAYETHYTAMPLMRALVMTYPGDAKASNLTDEWLMGPGLLAAPVLNAGGSRTVYLPADSWFIFGTNQVEAGPQTLTVNEKLDQIPVYVRAGTILPLGPVVQSTSELSTEPLEVQIYPGKNASFDFVEDDGLTTAYEKGEMRTTHFSWDDAHRTLSWASEGSYNGPNCFRTINAVLFDSSGKIEKGAPLDKSGSIEFPIGAGAH